MNGPASPSSGVPEGVRFSSWLWRGPGLVFAAPAHWEVTENSGQAFTIRSPGGVLRLVLLAPREGQRARGIAEGALRSYTVIADARISGEAALVPRNGFERYSIWGTGTHRGHPVRFGIVGYRNGNRCVYMRVFWYQAADRKERDVLERAADTLRPAEP